MDAAVDLPDSAYRKIIHIDMDAFYASVEQRDNPELRGKPVAVGGSGPRGVVAAASYEARAFGVRSAMPGGKARRLCPELIFAPPRFDAYRAVSQQIRSIFERFTDIIQPLSLDEAYLDVTRNKMGIVSATYIAQEIRRMIAEDTGLTASAGVSYNKLIAKLASDQNKPDGICVVTPERGAEFMAAMPVARIHGIGPVTARRMSAMGIVTGADLRSRDLPFLQKQAVFGQRSRCHIADDATIDERLGTPRLCLRGCFGLFGNRHPVSGTDQPREIGLGAVHRHTAHRDRRAAMLAARGERDIERGRRCSGIIKEQLEKIAHAIKQQAIFRLRFQRKILAHHRRHCGRRIWLGLDPVHRMPR